MKMLITKILEKKSYLNFRPVDVDVGESGLLGIVLDDDDFLGKL